MVFTRGCNFTCPYCHNPDLAAAPVSEDTGAGGIHTEQDVLNFLEKRKGLVQGVVITGGEPTLQKDLARFCGRVRSMGYKIKLDSNGTCPQVLAELLGQGLVDYIAMDIKTDFAHYPMVMKNKTGNPGGVDRIEKSIELIKTQAPAYEFRTTCVRPFITPGIMDRIGRMIRGADLYILQKCSRDVDVLDPEFIKDLSCFFSDRQMAELLAVAAPHVRSACIR